MRKKETLIVTIMSPTEVVFEGNALSVSSKNSDGTFDLLPDHARFMSLIEKDPIEIIIEDGSAKSFTYQSAVLFFEDNHAKVFVHKA